VGREGRREEEREGGHARGRKGGGTGPAAGRRRRRPRCSRLTAASGRCTRARRAQCSRVQARRSAGLRKPRATRRSPHVFALADQRVSPSAVERRTGTDLICQKYDLLHVKGYIFITCFFSKALPDEQAVPVHCPHQNTIAHTPNTC
jgi:hypothetical protein